MSLRVDSGKRHSRSKSPGRARERSRSHSRAPSSAPPLVQPQDSAAASSTPQHDHGYHTGSSHSYAPAEPITMGNYADLPPEERPGYVSPGQYHNYTAADRGPASPSAYTPPAIQYANTGQYGYTAAATNQPGPTRNPANANSFQYAPTPDKITFTAKPIVAHHQQPPPVRHAPASAQAGAAGQYQQQQQYPQYPQQHPQQPYYTTMPQAPQPPPAPMPPPGPPQHYPSPPIAEPPSRSRHQRAASSAGTVSTYGGHKVVEMVPQGGGRLNSPPSPGMRPHSMSLSGGRPDGLNARMDRLSVGGDRPDIPTLVPAGMGMPGGLPPSPMLEAYHGVYQSISPMPQAMMLDDDLDHLPPLDSLSPRASGASLHGGRRRAHSSAGRSPSPSRKSRSKQKDRLSVSHDSRARSRSREKRVKIYDAEQDALDLVAALSTRPPDPGPLIDILPELSHDQMLELRTEYKQHCKVQGRGINVAKHIKLKTSGNFGKIAYVTALGRYESEGFWANYWYQSGTSKRELLIEALVGRQNHEIRAIKDAFKDKKYGDSLTRCMDRELQADKFRKAILMALEAQRQEESDVWEIEWRNRDVDTLNKAMRQKDGGESTMLSVVVLRSDAHLREVLRTYERKYGTSFARDALRKCNNLVGEIIAHVLNGVINRPARDAMLLHHALTDLMDNPSHPSSSAKHDRQQRYELLISRLVRFHWDRLHLMRVKDEYQDKYRSKLEHDVEDATRGEFGDFCIALCEVGGR